MKGTRMPPAYSANLVANSGNTIYGVSVIGVVSWWLKCEYFITWGPFYKYALTLIPAWINNYMPGKVSGEIT